MKKAYVVGIAGATQSGKSTFAAELEAALTGVRVRTFHIDDYHRPKEEQPLFQAERGAAPRRGAVHEKSLYGFQRACLLRLAPTALGFAKRDSEK